MDVASPSGVGLWQPLTAACLRDLPCLLAGKAGTIVTSNYESKINNSSDCYVDVIGAGVHRPGGFDEGDSHGGPDWRGRGNAAWDSAHARGHSAISRQPQHGHRAVPDRGRRRGHGLTGPCASIAFFL